VPTVRTMAWVLDTDGRARGSTTKTKGRGKAQLPDENVVAGLAVCNLPDASIGGATCAPQRTSRKCTTSSSSTLHPSTSYQTNKKGWRGRYPVYLFLAMQSGWDRNSGEPLCYLFVWFSLMSAISGRCMPLSKRSA
jgi:hypothetical protein